MIVTALYAALLTPLFVVLSVRVILGRRLLGAALGDGGDSDMLRRIRVHANFTEYVPLALLLIGLAESGGMPAWLLHGLGAALLLGRLSHALGVSRPDEDFRFRVAGVGLTMTVLVVAAAACLALSVGRLAN